MRKKFLYLSVCLALLTPVFSVWAANDVVSVGPADFEIKTTDTAVTKTIVEADGGVATAFNVYSNYIDITLDNGSSAQFNTDGTVFFDIEQEGGTNNYSITPACPTTSVILAGTGPGPVILRMRVYLNPPGCGETNGPHFTWPADYSISINNGAATTTSRNVTVHLEAIEADKYILSNSPNFLSYDWQSFPNPERFADIPWTLTDGVGTKAVYVEFKSLIGNPSPEISDSIDLVAIPPSPSPSGELKFGDLIKDSSSTVYYYAKDGRRYIFPNAKTYFSWYPDFSSVKEISNEQILEIPRGNNVTYRPGVKMVKIQTDPKVYAVDEDGTLRWIETEAVARALYGDDWASQVDDLPEAFFTNYKIGVPVEGLSDFNPADATARASDIAADKGLNK